MNIIQGVLPNTGNYKSGRSSSIKYIVVHYTANKGDKAINNIKYFANNKVGASAHFFVDENSIYTSVPIIHTAYHCGGGLQGNNGHKYHKICTNSNSIGIEMCLWDKSGDIRQGTINKTIELVKHLMAEYNIPAKNVIRHWDVTGKQCPKPMIGDDNDLWKKFKTDIEEEIDMEEINKINESLTKILDKLNDIEHRLYELENPMVYNYIDKNMPKDFIPTIQKLKDNNVLRGNERGELGLNFDMLRILTILDRAKAFKELD